MLVKMLFWYLQLRVIGRHGVSARPSATRFFGGSPQCLTPDTCSIPPLIPFSYHAFKPATKYSDHERELDLFDLKRVVVIHRHGDRSQLNRKLGEQFPTGVEIDDFWNERLPPAEWEAALSSQAPIKLHRSLFEQDSDNASMVYGAYIGEDKIKSPYGMLTMRGVHQLVHVGNKIRQKYLSFVSDPSSIYARSTNYCRTHMSLRSLLLGLFNRAHIDVDTAEVSLKEVVADQVEIVTIFSRPKVLETMFPASDDSCHALKHHTQLAFKTDRLHASVPSYAEFRDHIVAALGMREDGEWFVPNNSVDDESTREPEESTPQPTEKWDWSDIKEVLTCHLEHDSNMCPAELEISTAAAKSTEIASRVWHDKYAVQALNKYALGRFFHELIEDLPAGLIQEPLANSDDDHASAGRSLRTDSVARNGAENKKLLIYSGHDSTIVPLVHALGVHSVFWPPYATHLVIEIAEKRNVESEADDQVDNEHDPLFARIWLNDEILPVKVDHESPTSAHCSKDANSNTDPGSCEWVPFVDVLNQLKKAAISFDAYNSDCRHPEGRP